MDEDLALRARLVPLGPWLDLASEANITYVRAQFTRPFPIAQIWAVMDGKPAFELESVLYQVGRLTERCRESGGRPFVRWECCSGSDVKHAMCKGSGYDPAFAEVVIDDPRLETPPFGCTVPDANGCTRLCVRPWRDAVIVEGYPVEFRVYYGPGGFRGVSSYYPQRPLPETWRCAAWRCARLSERLYEIGDFPVGFTADFLITLDGPVFLEGGPPHIEGPISAHPCCFVPGQVGGIALSAQTTEPADYVTPSESLLVPQETA